MSQMRTKAFWIFGGLLATVAVGRADVDPKAVEIVAVDQVKWVKSANGGSESALLFGDPSKPGPYVMRVKWLPGNMSRPHTHSTDRFFVVISGTWWVGSGTKYDPDSTVPVKPGGYVIHHAGQPHYDGAKGEETVIQVWGEGPLTTQSAEQKP
jgi:quercetin dioxygenase-like cupin family protein